GGIGVRQGQGGQGASVETARKTQGRAIPLTVTAVRVMVPTLRTLSCGLAMLVKVSWSRWTAPIGSSGMPTRFSTWAAPSTVTLRRVNPSKRGGKLPDAV